jgi:hypothetical protein
MKYLKCFFLIFLFFSNPAKSISIKNICNITLTKIERFNKIIKRLIKPSKSSPVSLSIQEKRKNNLIKSDYLLIDGKNIFQHTIEDGNHNLVALLIHEGWFIGFDDNKSKKINASLKNDFVSLLRAYEYFPNVMNKSASSNSNYLFDSIYANNLLFRSINSLLKEINPNISFTEGFVKQLIRKRKAPVFFGTMFEVINGYLKSHPGIITLEDLKSENYAQIIDQITQSTEFINYFSTHHIDKFVEFKKALTSAETNKTKFIHTLFAISYLNQKNVYVPGSNNIFNLIKIATIDNPDLLSDIKTKKD